jgi:glucose/arabinose dehydrogenase
MIIATEADMSRLTQGLQFLLRLFYSALCLGLLAACGGGGGNPGATGPMTPPTTSTGTLAVSASGLPAGVNAALRVTGPGNYLQDLAQSQTLSGLAPGSYNVSASPVSSGGVSYQPSPGSQAATISAGATTTATVAYSNGPLALGASLVVAGLDSPTWLSSPAGDARLFVTERRGRVRIVENGSVRDIPYLDIGARVSTEGEGGLLSLAFAPDFARTGYFYVYYTDLQRNIVVERFSAGATPTAANPTSSLVILRIPHPDYVNHFGGQLAFGPDGYLYLGTGDGGGAGDPQGNARNLALLLGKLLRIDVAGATVAQPYAIPPSNPYRDQGGRRPEIWASGLRNPWRFSFDASLLYLSDVGQERREEINIVNAGQGGQDFGWNVMEGTLCYGATSCEQSGLTLPAFEYEHGAGDVNGCSVTGGFVYRGRALPELAGRYFYSDYCGGYLKSFFATASGIVEQRDWDLPDIGPIVSFGQDADGELYLITAGGGIYKIGRSDAQ